MMHADKHIEEWGPNEIVDPKGLDRVTTFYWQGLDKVTTLHWQGLDRVTTFHWQGLDTE